MPTRILNTHETFETFELWLNENLNDINRIQACCEEANNVPTDKGIYFWFIHPDGYEALRHYVQITRIEPICQRNINGEIFDLVYLGTAGTGKKGNSYLQERLKWHLCQKHTKSSVCSGAISTIRSGLSALLAEDLIETNTEAVFNEFVCKYMFVYWLSYGNEDKEIIDGDEKVLIKTLKPLFNIKNNPNAKSTAVDNATKRYRKRRIEIKNSTLNRINCKGENEQTMRENNIPTDNAISYAEQVLTEENGCVEYTVSNGQDIAVVTRGIEGLPIGKCKIEILDSNNSNIRFKQWQRETGRNEDGQNIYTYFCNTSSDKKNKRSDVISQWMQENRIEEITVRVCESIKN